MRHAGLLIGGLILVVLLLAAAWVYFTCASGGSGLLCGVFRGGAAALDAAKDAEKAAKAVAGVAGKAAKVADAVANLSADTTVSSKTFGPPTHCPGGLEYYASACYNPCPAGYHRTAALTCQKGSTSTSARLGVDEACQAGLVEDGGLCYPPCPPNYHGVGPLCWPNTYGRGAGIVPKPVSCSGGCHTHCASGWDFFKHGCSTHCSPIRCTSEQCWSTHSDNQGGLCYTPPRPGFHCAGPVCYANGPTSTARGAGYVLGAPGPGGCKPGTSEFEGLCYPDCPAGMKRTAPLTCSSFKLWTSADFGIAKGGGLGEANGPQCPAGQEYWGGLCYEPCPAGSHRTGPATCLKNDWDQ